jgi:hypothetical protein
MPGSAASPYGVGTYEVGMCGYVGGGGWSFLQIISKGYAEVVQK